MVCHAFMNDGGSLVPALGCSIRTAISVLIEVGKVKLSKKMTRLHLLCKGSTTSLRCQEGSKGRSYGQLFTNDHVCVRSS